MAMRSRIAAGILLLLMLPSFQSCTGTDSVVAKSETVQMTRPPYRVFNASLEIEYIAIAKNKVDNADYEHVDLFVRKGLAAANGEIVMPEKPEAWILSDNIADEFDDARRKLLRALEEGARTKAPREAAHAQAMYDCWIDQRDITTKSHPLHDSDTCREDFWGTLALVEFVIGPKPKLEPGLKAPETVTRIYLVYSD
jgi:OmpA-OmpF porin, OOP family